MRIFSLVKIAYRSLNRNKLRSFLTMLGIIIGVASVIAMLAIGEGSNQTIKASVASLGINSIMIYPGTNNMVVFARGLPPIKRLKRKMWRRLLCDVNS